MHCDTTHSSPPEKKLKSTVEYELKNINLLESCLLRSLWGNKVDNILISELLCSQDVNKIILDYADSRGFHPVYEWQNTLGCDCFTVILSSNEHKNFKDSVVLLRHICTSSLYAFNLAGTLYRRICEPRVTRSDLPRPRNVLYQMRSSSFVFGYECEASLHIHSSSEIYSTPTLDQHLPLHTHSSSEISSIPAFAQHLFDVVCFTDKSYIVRNYISNKQVCLGFFWRTDVMPLQDSTEPQPYFKILFSKGRCRKVEVGERKLFFFLCDMEDKMWLSSLEINTIETDRAGSRLHPAPLEPSTYMGSYQPLPEKLPTNVICQCYIGNQEFLFGAMREPFAIPVLYRWNVETNEMLEEWSGRISAISTLGNTTVIVSAGKVIFLA